MIREAKSSDLAQLLEIERFCFTSCWTENMFSYEIEENEFGKFYVMEENNKLIGFIDFWITFECCQLANIAIDPSYQGQGKSKELMNLMVDQANEAYCDNIMLEVRPSNTKARKLYETYDFIEINRRKGYYNDNGEDAIIMCKALGGNWV